MNLIIVNKFTSNSTTTYTPHFISSSSFISYSILHAYAHTHTHTYTYSHINYYYIPELNFRPKWLYITDPEESKALEEGYKAFTDASNADTMTKDLGEGRSVNFLTMRLAAAEGSVPLKRVHVLWVWKGDDGWVPYSFLATVIIQTAYLMREPWVDLPPAALGMPGQQAEYRVLFAKMHQHKITNEQRYRRVAFIASPEAPCFPLTIPLVYNPPAAKVLYPDYWEPFSNKFEYHKTVSIPLDSDEAKRIDDALNKSIYPGGRKKINKWNCAHFVVIIIIFFFFFSFFLFF